MSDKFNLHSAIPERPDPGYTIKTIAGCRVVTGSVPLRDMPMLCHGFSKKAFMDIDLADRMGVAMVIGEPQDLEWMRANKASLPISDSRRRDSALATSKQLPAAVATWLLEGERGMSSDALCQVVFGVPEGPRRTSHPHDPDDLRRCLAFLEAVGAMDTESWRTSVAALSKEWAALMAEWDALLACYTDELRTADKSAPATPATYALMKQMLGKPQA